MTVPAELVWQHRGAAQDAVARRCRLADVEVEPHVVVHREVAAFLREAAPAVLRVADGHVAVARTGRRAAIVVGPGGRSRRVPLPHLRAAICAGHEATARLAVEPLLVEAPLSPRSRERLAGALVADQLGSTPVEVGVVVRPAAGAPLRAHVRHARLGRGLIALAASHVGLYAAFLALWATVGDAALGGAPFAGVLPVVAALVLAVVALRAVATWSAGTVAVAAGVLLKRRLFAGTLGLPVERVRTDGAGRLLGRVLEAEAVETLALSGGYLGFLAAVELLAAGVVLAAGPRGAVLVALLTGWVLGVLLLGRLYVRRRRRWTAARVELTDDLVERLVGHRTRLAQEGPARRRGDVQREALARYDHLGRGMDRVISVLFACATRGWAVVAVAAVVAGGGARVDQSSLAVAFGGVLLAASALAKLGRAAAQLADAVVAWDRVAPLVQPPGAASAPSDEGDEDVEPAAPLVLAEEVVFSHSGRAQPVLAGVSLAVDHGEQVLLEGPSGSGKSTLASILAGLRDADAGAVRCAGTRTAAARRRHVVLAPQFGENHVLSASFAFNLLLGRQWPPSRQDLAEAEAVCRELGMGPLLDAMPAGLEQMVGETGWQLSHGERSRLFVARALLQRADLVILDESFAALDPPALAKALQCVRRRAGALVVIAHEEPEAP